MQLKSVPRWIHQTVKIPRQTTLDVSAITFDNDEIFPFELKFISFCSDDVAYLQRAAMPGNLFLGYEIGYSGYSAINEVGTTTMAIGESTKPSVNAFGKLPRGSVFKFETPVELAPNNGLVVEVQNLLTDSLAEDVPDESLDDLFTDTVLTVKRLGFIAIGYTVEGGRRRPAMLTGYARKELGMGSSEIFDKADLWNNGSEPLFIQEIILDTYPLQNYILSTSLDAVPTAGMYNGNISGTKILWRINPSSGVPWMPNRSLIPVGNIAPYNQYPFDYEQFGPRVYDFPKNIMLNPRQRLSIKTTNFDMVAHEVEICLFGYLKVS